jgi:hypothetical protein
MSTEPHPLQDIVLAAFVKRERHDPVTLGTYLAGGYTYGVMNAYRIVARDALEYMAAQGLLERDTGGRFCRASSSPSGTSP